MYITVYVKVQMSGNTHGEVMFNIGVKAEYWTPNQAIRLRLGGQHRYITQRHDESRRRR